MKNTKNKLNSQSKIVKASATGSNITRYSGLNTVAKYKNRQNIVKVLGKTFTTCSSGDALKAGNRWCSFVMRHLTTS
jgi:hypothetical protein